MLRLLLSFFSALLFSAFSILAQDSLSGFWQSDGYGYVLKIGSPGLQFFEVTATTCVPSFFATKRNTKQASFDAIFDAKDDGVFFILPGSSPDSKFLRPEESVSPIPIRRIASLPASCRTPFPNTPSANFEVFAQTWAEHYISFERRQTDWPKRVNEYRARLTPHTTPAQLFDLFEQMIAPLADLHVALSAPNLKRSTKQFWRPGTDRLLPEGIEAFAEHGRWKLYAFTDQVNLHAPAKMYCHRGLHYGHLDAQTGYLRIRSFGGFANANANANDKAALEACLDSIFKAEKIRALVLDMRLSLGGSDDLALTIASRFTAKPYLAYKVKARTGSAPNTWTAPQPVMVTPSPRPGFHGPIAVLTSPITMSAAESFVLALMGRDAPLTRIGENTQGVFCDVLSRRLPNSWTLYLPNAVYETPDGQTFDVTGIPPDILVPVFTDADLSAKRDPAVETAKRLLSRP